MELDKLNTEADAIPARGNETVLQMPATRRHSMWDDYKNKASLLFKIIIATIILLSLFYSILMTGAKTSAEEKLQVLDRSAKQLIQLFGHPAIGAVSSEWTTNSTKI